MSVVRHTNSAGIERERVQMERESDVTASELLKRAAEAGVFLSHNEDRLHFKLAVESFPEALKGEILANKGVLISFLKQRTLDDENALNRRPRIVPHARETNELPTSFAQQRLWFIDQLDGGSPQYNMPGGLRIRGRFSEDIAERALRRIIERHEPLRTVFRNSEDGPVQHIRESFDFQLQRTDLSGMSSAEQEQRVRKAADADALKAFDLSADLMLRAAFMRLSEAEGVLLFNMHHIASDGWSMSILVNEFTTLYEAFAKGEADPLQPLEVQYADYAQWQREWLEGEVLERQLQYWEEQLAELPQVHGLALDHPRPAVQTFNGALHSFTLDRPILTVLKQLALEEQATLFMVLQGVFALLLSRHSNSHDIVLGTPVANRLQKELEPLVGFFVNTLVLRTDTRAGRTFREYLAELKRTNLDAQANQDVPFEYLVERLKPQRSTSHAPLFQIMFNMNTNEAGTVQLRELELTPLRSERVAVKFDLMLDVLETAEGLQLDFSYNTDLFAAETIERLGEHFQNLARGVVANAAARIEQLPLLSESEQQHLLYELNETAADYEREACLHELFEAQMELQPEAVALVYGDRQLSYGELNEQANQLAHYLRRRGVGPETIVGICMERSVEMMVALLGVLKAGAGYLPLDPSYPRERLAFMIEDSAIPVLLTQQRQESLLPAHSAQVVYVDTDWQQLSEESTANPERRATPGNLAYVIYTSGSTGKPKGVIVTHANVTRLFQATEEWFHFNEQDVWTLFHSYAFDFSVWELWGALLYGGKLVIVPYEVSRAPEAFYQLLSREGVTVLNQTPFAFRQLIQAEELSPRALPLALRLVIFGGEALELQSLAPWFARHGDQQPQLVNMYGITETTVHVTYRPLSEEDLSEASVSPIGGPIHDLQLYALDEHLQLVPRGVAGELYVGGAGLARNYLKRPELTADRFLPNPFSARAGERLYRTGDQVCYRADGELVYVGRVDQQIKIRGFRIELGEIEAALRQQEGVQQALALVREDTPGEKRLVAYVSLHTDGELKQSEVIAGLRQQLQWQLPDYMVPARFVLMDQWPLTATGKIDRKKLPAPDYAAPDEEYVAPATETEIALAKIWADLLKLDANAISATANFFELGGHSLLSVRLLTQIKAQWNVELQIRDIFEAAQLSSLAVAIERNSNKVERPRIVPHARETNELPTSFAQQRLWFIDQLDGGSPQYNMPGGLRVRGRFSEDIAERALRRIIERHEPLRTVFRNSEDGPVQHIRESFDFQLQRHDLSGMTSAEQEQRVREAADADALKPFDLSADLMLRAAFMRLSEAEGVLLFNMHHIASDGWSMSILVNEFTTLYEAFAKGEADPLQPLEVQYADYAQWQREWLEGEVLERQLAYWEEQLTQLPQVHGLALDHPRPAVQTFNGALHSFTLDRPTLTVLKQLALEEQATLFMVLQGVFALLLSRHSNSHDIVLGTPVANRLQKELEPLVGFFVNTLVLRTDTRAGRTFREYLAELKRTNLDAQANQDVPFEYLVERLKPQRSTSHAPLFQIMFNMNTNEAGTVQLRELELTPLRSERVAVKFDLMLDVMETAEGLQLDFSYNTDLFAPKTIERLGEHFQNLARGVAANAAARIEQLPLLSESEQQQLLFELNETTADYASEACLHELFEAQVARHPEAVALVYGDRQLSYRELNQQANQVAHYLREQGVGPDVLVGLCVERSLAMVIGMLGILKAGGAYVPLDPSYPQERLEYMIADSAPALVLTQDLLEHRLPLSDVRKLRLDADKELLSAYPTHNLKREEVGLTSGNLAYVIYTSGSTGRPKGVMGLHRSSVNRFDWMWNAFPFTESDVCCQKTSLSFVNSIWEIFGPLLEGIPLVIIPTADVKDPQRLVEALSHHNVTRLVLVPSLLRMLLESDIPLDERLPHLNLWVCSGETLTKELSESFAERLPGRVLLNLYGSSEVAADVTYHKAGDEADAQRIPIGKPVANTQIYILDEQLRPVPRGVIGEIYVAGDNLSRGYLHNPELTAEKFLPCAYANVAGATMYSTGDLGRWLPSGAIEHFGRNDFQVKIRGLRIELGEIEHELASLDEIKAAVVMAREDEPGLKRLVAYITLAGDAASEAEVITKVRTALQSRLPDYMVPSAFVVLHELPLTPSGKVDRIALPIPDGSAEQMSTYIAPRNETEQALCEVWQEVLKLEQVGVQDNFFSFGGDSILSIQVVTRANRAGIPITVQQIFAHQTIAELAAQVESEVFQPAGEVVGEMPLLPFQRELLAADSSFHNENNQALLLIAPEGFELWLHLVVEALYRQHEALRLRFTITDSVWSAAYAPLTPAMVSESCVIETLPEDVTLHSEFINERCAHYHRSLDINHGPLFRAVYFHNQAQQPGHLFLVIHQLIVDEISWRVLLRDLDDAYRQVHAGGPIQFAVKHLSYQQWGQALSAYAQADALQREREYWHESCAEKLGDGPMPSLDAATYASVRTVPVELSVEETTALLEHCTATYHAQINELLLAAVYLALRQWSGQSRVRITLEEQGRDDLLPGINAADIVGCFTTSYPLVLHNDQGGITAGIKSVKDQYRAVPHQGVGYGLLRHLLGDQTLIAAEANDPPVLLFKYQSDFHQMLKADSSFALAGEFTGDSISPHHLRNHALCLSGSVTAGALRFRLDYSERHFSEVTIEALANSLREALRALIAHARESSEGYYTPRDFPLATVDQSMLDELQKRYDIEQLYPATAMQKGMLFHSLMDREAYVTQIYPTLEGDLQLELLQQAWQTIVERHAMLRTAFVGEGDLQQQLVLKQVSLPWHLEDLRGLSAAEQSARFEEYRRADKAKGFEATEAPLMRISVFRLTDNRYWLLWSHHHSLLDGWSISLVYREVMEVYDALERSSAAALAPAPDYARYIDWLLHQDQEKACGYWQAYLSDVDEVTQLPYDGPARSRKPIHLKQETSLSPSDTARLRAFAKRHHTTVNTLLQLAWSIVLRGYAGQQRVTFGAVISGRLAEVSEIDRMVGLFINSIPVNVSLEGNESLAETIKRLHATFQRSQEFGYLALPEIQKQSRLGAGAPLFESLLVFENYALDLSKAVEASAGSVRIGEIGADIQDTYPLALSLFQGESLQVVCNYFGDRFNAATVSGVLDQFVRVLQQLPECERVRDVRLLTEGQAAQVLAAGQGPRVVSDGRCIHEQIREQAQQTPEAVAVVHGEQTLSYAELDARSDRLARYLVAAGVGVESRVGLYLRRSPELLIGVLGVLKAGVAYVPLEPGLPSERVSYMLADARVEWVLVESEQMAELPLSGVDVVLMDGASTEPQWLAESSELDAVMPAVGSEQLAYILYTSGSTGRPKGVMVEHGGLAHYLGHAAAAYLTAEIAGSVVSSPLSFDATLTTLLAPLLVGRRVELLADDERLMEQLAERLFAANGNQLFKLTPAHLEALQYVERPQAVGRAAHVLVLGGEQLSAALLRRWKQELLPRARFVNEYGPTEAVVGCSVWWLRDETGLAQLEGLTAPIGRPIGNTELYVLGAERQLLPWQSVGELYIGGAGVARGYLNQAELTAARFIDSPFSEGGRLYRTGDLVRWLGSGELQFVGRSDDQVKLRGFRIELGEIEQQLETVGGVKAAVVLAREDEPGRKRLVAYVAVNGERQSDAELSNQLRQALQTRLPEYMVPSAFVLLDELPLTVNGKVDRRALPAPEGESQLAAYVAPRNAVEQALCEVWQEVLKRERVGIEDNFFSLGGDSILSIRVVALLKSRGIALGINDIFQHQTIALLAAQARAVESEGAALEPFALLTEAERAELADSYIYEDAYPMSTLQTGMVFHTQLEQFSGVYHDIVVEHVKCAWDQASFEQALTACVAEHPVLRTVFRLDGERPLQLVRRAVELPLEVVDLRPQADAEAEQYVQDWVEARKRHVFDWEQGPLWQLNIFLRTEESFQFVLSFHHAVLDGWSRAVLTTELYNRYQQLLTSQEAEPVTTDWTYRDFIAQEQRVLADEAAREYFARLLEGAPSEQLPRQKAVSTGVVHESIVLQGFAPLSRQLLELARELGVPVQTVLLAGHFKVLSTLSGQTKALSCVTHNGRPETAGAERSLGLYLNSLPQAIELGSGSWRDLINEVARLNAASMSYRGYPLSQIQQETGLVLNEITFNYTHYHVFGEMNDSAQPFEVLGSSAFEQTNFDFHVDVMRWLSDDSLSMTLIYNPELYERELIERVRGYYQRAYEQLLTGLDQPHQEQSLLSATEVAAVQEAAHGPAVTYAPQCIHEVIREQAQQTPEAVAVVYGEQTLSYAELDARSDRLARYLVAAGVGVESRVGLYLWRSPELLIGVLGVLKAGAAYVPLEPGLPSERVSYMLSDARVEWVLVGSEQMAELPLSGVDVVLMDGASTDPEWLAEISELDAVTPAVGNEQLAYILYTSGSTGRPKGVMVEHGGLGHYLGHAAAAYLTAEIEGSVVSSPLSFDATLTTLLAPLLVGRRVELLADDERLMEQLAARLFAAESNQLFKLTPAHLEALQYVERPQAVGTAAHVLVLGGEQLSAALLRRWKQELLPRARFVNEYGPTEAVVGCSVWWLRDETGLAQLEGLTAAPIGRPIRNTELYVLGAERQLLPWQSVGELYIGGAGVARGYLNQAELTAARFIESPFSEGGRLYRTGDLVRWLGSGELQFVGRSDDQVKLRGFRIELGEIEQQLETVVGVKAAVVLAREDEPGRKRLVAYVAVNGERQTTSDAELSNQIRQALQTRLPEYMVPSAFVLLDELPLTVNGKVDRRALPAPEGESQLVAYVAPRNAVEQALCEVWQEVLKRERVGIEDNFFSLGGDSILSIRVVALLKSRGIALGINDIFQHQTIALLAAQARAVESEGAVLEPFALLTAAERAGLGEGYEAIYEDAYPMSTLQTGMVFHTQLEQFSGVYHDIVAEHVKCAWDQASFEQALAACVAEHPVLRTVFRLAGERPLQLVRRAVELPLEVVDLREQADAESYVQEWIEARKRHVFDWEQGPLWQLNIFLRTEDSFQFVLSFHHAVLDGWSRAVLTTELYNRYQQLLTQQEPEAVTTDWTYRDFIAQEQRVLSDEAARQYFARMLEDAPSEQLPRSKRVSTHLDTETREWLPVKEFAPLSRQLLGVARELGVPIQAVLLAGHFKVLSTLSGQSKALSCVTHNGRPETAGGEHSLGLYLNSLPQALELGHGSWRDLINDVAQLNAASMSYRGYPLSQIQQETGLVLNEITFNYTHYHVFGEMTDTAQQPFEVLGSFGFEQTNFDFHVDVARGLDDDSLRLMLIYNTQLYERELIERVSGYYQRAYEQMLTGLDQSHQAQSLLSAAEIEQVEAAAHGPVVEYASQCIHEQIQEQAQQTPEAMAVVYGEQTLSYAELDEKAERLARYLVAAGVGVESRVGLYLRRSPELLIGVLGVLKAGAAYVPLEPGLPSERVSYMLGDAQVEWVLVESEQMAELPLSGVDVVLMDGASTDPEWLAESSELDAVTPAVGREQLAYILYTSGSTGRPKGVMVEHGGLAHYLGHAAAAYLTAEIEGSVVSSPLSFDATLTTLLAPLLVGRRVELLADDERLMEQLAARLFSAESNNKLFKLTPAHLEALQYVERPQAVGTVAHVLVLGGEQLSAVLLRRWEQELLPRARFVNEYGPTEAVVGCSVWWLRDETGLKQLEGLTAAPIGRPIGNTELYVLGAERQLLPWQSVGELYIGGAGVARGYLNQAELTAARFIDSPFSEGGRLYRTGDLVRWLGSGELQFVGRSDDQVKLRGFRIELGEIEQQLETVAGVKAAVVLAREDELERKRLVAYVVPDEYPADEKAQALLKPSLVTWYRDELALRLPHYMVPTDFVLLTELPLTPNGKVDRRALPAPESDMELAFYVAPRNAVEQALCEVWQEVLNRDQIGIEDNFFSLGGDSILSIRVVAMLKSRGIALGINDIFQYQTIALLATQARETLPESETFIDTNQIAQMLISERDELNENMIEAIL